MEAVSILYTYILCKYVLNAASYVVGFDGTAVGADIYSEMSADVEKGCDVYSVLMLLLYPFIRIFINEMDAILELNKYVRHRY